LFLVAGAVYYATKETSLDKMGGLARNMKFTTVFFVIGLLAVSGMPPLNGFASKLMLYESTYQLNPIITIIAVLASILMLAVFAKVFYSVFMGPEQPKFKEIKEVPKSMLIAMGAVVAIIIIFGLFPNLIVKEKGIFQGIEFIHFHQIAIELLQGIMNPRPHEGLNPLGLYFDFVNVGKLILVRAGFVGGKLRVGIGGHSTLPSGLIFSTLNKGTSPIFNKKRE